MSSRVTWNLKRYLSGILEILDQQRFVLVLFSLLFAIPSISQGEGLQLIRIGTGGKTGVYYPIGKLIAQGLTNDGSEEGKNISGENGVPGYISVAQNSAGSIENVKKVISCELEAGLVQADVAVSAFEGTGVFKGNDQANGIRAIASLYPEKFQIVVRDDANIKTFKDLYGKRISVDEIGSGTLNVMRIVLAAHGMSEKDLFPVYLKPVFTNDKIMSGELQGFVVMAGAPMAAVSQFSDVGVTLVSISADAAAWIESKYAYLVPGSIPAGTYKNVPEVNTIQVHALLAVDVEMDEELAYQLTAALYSQRTLALLKAGHPQGKSITRESALTGIPIPLHPGAERYYKENPDHFNFHASK